MSPVQYLVQMAAQFTFGDRMRQRRKALDLTQEELARQVSCALVTIQKIESGQRRPSRQLAELLAQRLEIPAGEIQAFVQMARSGGEAGFVQEARATTQLPSPLTSFIGRRQEIRAVCDTLLQPQVRLLTLTGPPGVGKTRLAIQAAEAVQSRFEHGASFIPLATACDAELVIPAIAHSMGFAQAGPGPILNRLQEGLRGRSLLLVLDNFEQVIEAAPQIAGLLSACSSLKALVTSRLALRLSGEQLFPVEPLPLPSPESAGPAPWESLENYASIELFVGRVKSYRPGFRLTKHNAPAIQEICTRLDGLPLAIELAAARLRALTPSELAAQLRSLERPLQLLGDGPRDLPGRHQYFHNTVGWSYSLLDPSSQRLFRHAAVFAGGFDFHALAAVGGVQTVQELMLLVEHNLLRMDVIETQDRARYSMLETMRAFGLEQLADNDEDMLARQRHAETFLASVKPGEEQSAWFDWCELEHDNLRLALQWWINQGDGLQASQMCFHLSEFWEFSGYQHEAKTWFDLIQALDVEMPLEWKIENLYSQSLLNWQLGDFEASTRYGIEALLLCREKDASAQELCSPIAPLDLAGLPYAALPGLESRAMTLWLNLARGNIEGGAYALAELSARQSLSLGRQMQDSYGISGALLHLGEIALAQGQLSEAFRLQEEAWSQLPKGAEGFWGVLVQENLGELYLVSGQFAESWQHLARALDFAATLQHSRPLTLVLAICAGWMALSAESDLERKQFAVQIWAAVWVYRNRRGLAFSKAHGERIETWQAQCRACLGDARWDESWMRGLDLSIQDCIQFLKAF